MPKILKIGQVAALFGVSRRRLAQIDDEHPIPGGHPSPGGQREFYDCRGLRERAAAKRDEKAASRRSTIWKYNIDDDWPAPTPTEKAEIDARLAAIFSDLPGVKVLPHGLDMSEVPESAKAAVFRAIFRRQHLITQGLPWWLGDHLLTARKSGMTIPVARQKEHGRNLFVAEFYPPDERDTELSFNHHEVAAHAANGNLAQAKEWLSLAKTKGWKHAELRAYLRAQK